VVTGGAALRLHGGGYFDGLARDGRTRLPVPLAANGERLREHPGITVFRDTVPDDEVVVVHEIRCSSIERALFDEIRRLPDPREQVVAADMTFAAQLTSIRRMRRYRASRHWFRDVRRLDDVLVLADEHMRSGPEVRFRLIWDIDAGWGHPLVNRAVLDVRGRLIGVPDLFDVERGIVGEYAGADHRDVDQHGSPTDRRVTRGTSPSGTESCRMRHSTSPVLHRSPHHSSRAALASSASMGPRSNLSSRRNL
jgi:hypothetical protein